MDEISSTVPNRMMADPAKTGQTTAQQERKLRKACADFEAMLAFQMIKTMRQSVPKNGFLKRSQAQQTYEMMLDQKMAEELAGKGGGLGLQKMLYNQITRLHSKGD
jgi:flagellar protein FlgJ